jgi:hypothetical protein
MTNQETDQLMHVLQMISNLTRRDKDPQKVAQALVNLISNKKHLPGEVKKELVNHGLIRIEEVYKITLMWQKLKFPE